MAKKKKKPLMKRIVKGAKEIVEAAEKVEKKRIRIGKRVREFQEKGKASQTEYMERGGFVIRDYPPKRKPVKRKKRRK